MSGIGEIRVSVTYPGGEGQAMVIPIPEETAWTILAASADSREEQLHHMMMAIDTHLPDGPHRPAAPEE